MKLSPIQIEQVACCAYEATRGVALALGSVGVPTWQIARLEIREAYRKAVLRVAEGCPVEKLADDWALKDEAWSVAPAWKRLQFRVLRAVVLAHLEHEKAEGRGEMQNAK